MHIAVDARNIKPPENDEDQHTLALLQKLIQSRPEHHFTIVTTKAGLLTALPNLDEYKTETKVENYFQLRSWSNKTLPSVLKEIGADALLSINSAITNAGLRQVVFLSSPNAAELPFAKSFLFSFLKKYLYSRIAKATGIATFTRFQQTIIAKKLHIKLEQITPVGYTVPPFFEPADWQQKETILLEQTNGSEYFLYTGSFEPETFLLVLKAFSMFKKRQLSNMQLIAAGNFVPGKDLMEKLATYKYRADVKLLMNADLQTRAIFTRAAYATIFFDEKSSVAFSAATALQCGVPVIALQNNTATKQLAGPAALYAEPTPESLAEQMKQLYKDENLRKQLITNAAGLIPLLNGDIAVQKLWDCLIATGT